MRRKEAVEIIQKLNSVSSLVLSHAILLGTDKRSNTILYHDLFKSPQIPNRQFNHLNAFQFSRKSCQLIGDGA